MKGIRVICGGCAGWGHTDAPTPTSRYSTCEPCEGKGWTMKEVGA